MAPRQLTKIVVDDERLNRWQDQVAATLNPVLRAVATRGLSLLFADAGGAYGRDASFSSDGGDLVILWSGSSFVSAPGAANVLTLVVDGQQRGTSTLFLNPALTHATHPLGAALVAGLAAGRHSLSVSLSGAASQSDANDHLTVAVLELL